MRLSHPPCFFTLALIIVPASSASQGARRGWSKAADVVPLSLRRTPLGMTLLEWLTVTNVDYAVDVGGNVTFLCKNNVTVAFAKEYPQTKWGWVKDGDPVTVDNKRMLVVDFVFVLNKVQLADGGTYECRMTLSSGTVLTADVFTLTVLTPLPTLVVRQTDPFRLDCRSEALVSVLRVLEDAGKNSTAQGLARTTEPSSSKQSSREAATITRRWHFNATNTPFFPMSVPADKPSPDVFPAAVPTMTGPWTCSVRHVATRRTWMTAWHRLRVAPPPSALELWWRRVLLYPEAVAAVSTMLLILLLGLSLLVARLAQEKINLEQRFFAMRKRLLRRKNLLWYDGSRDTEYQKPRRLKSGPKRLLEKGKSMDVIAMEAKEATGEDSFSDDEDETSTSVRRVPGIENLEAAGRGSTDVDKALTSRSLSLPY